MRANMKRIYNYRIYLVISLISLFAGGLLNVLSIDTDSEKFALLAFYFFTIAVVIAAFEELISSRPYIAKKIKLLSRIWKK